jgi:hypothetical protein
MLHFGIPEDDLHTMLHHKKVPAGDPRTSQYVLRLDS